VKSIVQYLDYANLALLTLVALVAVRQWRAGRGRAGLWAALAFGTLAVVVDVGPALPEDPETTAEKIALRILVVALVLFPYLVYRFTVAFRKASRRLERVVGGITAAMLVWTLALPDIPSEGEPQPEWWIAYLAAFLVHWTVLSVASAVQLWWGGRGQPTVTRRRMELFAFALALMTTAIIVSVVSPDEATGYELAVSLLLTATALAFLLGLAPPAPLRMLWRRPEQERLQDAVTELVGAATEEEVGGRVLPPMARIVGARTVELQAEDGRVIASYGERPPAEEGPGPTVLQIANGRILLWTSPYAPFFGRDELRLLAGLAGLTGIALDRSRLFAQEREARQALERADELKTNFVALAAHELRAPVATVHGLAQTLLARRPDLPDEQVRELELALGEQTDRLKLLVEQLLDLSRLDAEAMPIEPARFGVRERIDALVAAARPERVAGVSIEVPSDLEVVVDPHAFDRVVSNLLENAIRYGAPPVTIKAEAKDRHLRVVVEDEGPGVPAEFVPELFERFTRSSAGRARGGGTGLGLAIARSYANAQGGDVLYERTGARGARFQLVLPLSK
jgi:signal transduction histidine kinase